MLVGLEAARDAYKTQLQDVKTAREADRGKMDVGTLKVHLTALLKAGVACAKSPALSLTAKTFTRKTEDIKKLVAITNRQRGREGSVPTGQLKIAPPLVTICCELVPHFPVPPVPYTKPKLALARHSRSSQSITTRGKRSSRSLFTRRRWNSSTTHSLTVTTSFPLVRMHHRHGRLSKHGRRLSILLCSLAGRCQNKLPGLMCCMIRSGLAWLGVHLM